MSNFTAVIFLSVNDIFQMRLTVMGFMWAAYSMLCYERKGGDGEGGLLRQEQVGEICISEYKALDLCFFSKIMWICKCHNCVIV